MKDVRKDHLQHVKRLKVVLFDLHLNVEASELGEVPVRVACSARNTGPISNTRSKSLHIDICLYSCGLCAKHACCWKYCSLNTAAPPSDAPAIIFGVWISTKPLALHASRHRSHTPLLILMIAF